MDSSRKAEGTGLRKAGAAAGLIAAALLTTAATMAPAQAAPAPKPPVTVTQGADGALILHFGRPAGKVANVTASAVPTTSPTVSHLFLPYGEYTDCPSGYACAAVPSASGWYVFKFYNYGGYSLSYWSGTGSVWNNQTGGAALRVDDVNGSQLRCIAAGTTKDVDWNPAWRIRLTSSGC